MRLLKIFKNDKVQKFGLLFISLLLAFELTEQLASFLQSRERREGEKQSTTNKQYLKLYKQLYMVSPNHDVSYEHRSNVDVNLFSKEEEYLMRVVTNSEGLREEMDIPFGKLGNEKRIIGLGDSVMFGASVENTETFLRVIERFLSNERFKVKTLNFGVAASNPRLEYHYLKYKKGVDYQPDIILLNFSQNDFEIKYRAFNPEFGTWYYPDPPELDDDVGSRNPLWFVKRIYFKSKVIRLLIDFRNRSLSSFFALLGYDPRRSDDLYPVNKNERKLVKYWFGKMKEYSDNANAKFLVIVLPQKDQLEFAFKNNYVGFTVYKEAMNICKEVNISCYNLIPDLVAYLKTNNTTIDQLYWDNMHPAKNGNEVIGQLVAKWIKDNKWLEN